MVRLEHPGIHNGMIFGKKSKIVLNNTSLVIACIRFSKTDQIERAKPTERYQFLKICGKTSLKKKRVEK